MQQKIIMQIFCSGERPWRVITSTRENVNELMPKIIIPDVIFAILFFFAQVVLSILEILLIHFKTIFNFFLSVNLELKFV